MQIRIHNSVVILVALTGSILNPLHAATPVQRVCVEAGIDIRRHELVAETQIALAAWEIASLGASAKKQNLGLAAPSAKDIQISEAESCSTSMQHFDTVIALPQLRYSDNQLNRQFGFRRPILVIDLNQNPESPSPIKLLHLEQPNPSQQRRIVLSPFVVWESLGKARSDLSDRFEKLASGSNSISGKNLDGRWSFVREIATVLAKKKMSLDGDRNYILFAKARRSNSSLPKESPTPLPTAKESIVYTPRLASYPQILRGIGVILERLSAKTVDREESLSQSFLAFPKPEA